MLAHPGPSDLACDAVRVLNLRERQQEDQVPLVDLDDLRSERACVDDRLHGVLRGLHGSIRHRLAQVKVVDDHVHVSRT